MGFQDASLSEINQIMEQAALASQVYGKMSLISRAGFMRAIAGELDAIRETLLITAMEETHLPQPRLNGELNRTIYQLNSYADACVAGNWLEARIDTAIPEKMPPKPDIRKMLVPLGPVVVFGASNFPFAYSTAGGDTACALAAGCPVIVKAHPAHARTSELAAGAIMAAAGKCGLPKGVFAHIHSSGFEGGRALVSHPAARAVGFTGSFSGGKALFDIASQRKEPITVFSEMGSINPVFLLSEKIRQEAEVVAKMYAASITLSAGQFCTNPGLLVGIDGPDLEHFLDILGSEIQHIKPSSMLHPGIAAAYREKKALALSQQEVRLVAQSDTQAEALEGIPTIASVHGDAFLSNPLLHQEVFGPYSLVIRCRNQEQMLAVARHLEGQLTCTAMATPQDIRDNPQLMDAIGQLCGRFILNGVPTGVEVCLSMHHGGPYPATTDSRYTSVGADGIKRFARPLCFQNWDDQFLPDELKNANPLGIWRTVNDQLTKEPITS